MTLRSSLIPALLASCVAAAAVAPVAAQSVYSYVDESGVRIFTNIPPKRFTQEVEVKGSPQPSPHLPRPQPAKPVAGSMAVRAAEFDPIIEKYSREFSLDPALVRSVIATESAFDRRAVSRKGAQGLMQLMPSTATRLGVRNPFDAEENIRGGVKHLRTLFDTFDNDLLLTLAAYNAGENLVQRTGRIPNFRETHDYVRSVTTRYGRRNMAVPPKEPARPVRPTLFRYFDASGVLHLTDTPPVQRVDPAAGAGNFTTSPQQ